jgi:hypothetical protein
MEGVAGVVHTPSQISSSLARSRTRPEAARYAWPAPAPARGELHTGPLNRTRARRSRATRRSCSARDARDGEASQRHRHGWAEVVGGKNEDSASRTRRPSPDGFPSFQIADFASFHPSPGAIERSCYFEARRPEKSRSSRGKCDRGHMAELGEIADCGLRIADCPQCGVRNADWKPNPASRPLRLCGMNWIAD